MSQMLPRRMAAYLQLGFLNILMFLRISKGHDYINGTSQFCCTVDYISEMTCDWVERAAVTGDQCMVQAEDNMFANKCEAQSVLDAVLRGSSRSCSLSFSFFTIAQSFNVTLWCHKNGHKSLNGMIEMFEPSSNIKIPRPDIVANMSTNDCQFSWTVPKTITDYMALKSELRYKPKDGLWKDSELLLIESVLRTSIDLKHLKPSQVYVAQIRVKTLEGRGIVYRSVWSQWSLEVEWETPGSTINDGNQMAVWGVLSLISIVVTMILVFVNRYMMPKRLKKLKWFSVPDPGKFFYDLNSIHGGNFQKWLGGRLTASFYTAEELGTEISPVEISSIKDSESFIKKDYISDGSSSWSAGTSSLSSFANQGYFWFSYPNCVEMEPCKVYFSYGQSGAESGSEESGSYQCLTTSNDSLYEDLDVEPTSPGSECGGRGRLGFDRVMEEVLASATLTTSAAEVGHVGQLLGNVPHNGRACDLLPPKPQIAFFQFPHYSLGSRAFPHTMLLNEELEEEEEGEEDEGRQGCKGLSFGDQAVSQCSGVFRQEAGNILKAASLNLGRSCDAYLSLKEVQSTYSNKSI
ncbi:interleukin-2 receptor subunit beta [Callorhinchus milii]|uniref:Fibronectin type-III domain-containing protein n=1 Tax=Callorhinchus milii TaxID=7868 RepID=A0A4W3HEC2_CALMI|nr:interleukin-2 receptor subunit beta [Callorhinchus milii]XP_042200846.1 interleukin-2 receptor subunit beta [Callorhinchus milii]|eukprot:gi/632983097/ref/XP_007908478.1/ PREDICTED: interleukin-2 receptor subunit beta [Callorhinchus milii]